MGLQKRLMLVFWIVWSSAPPIFAMPAGQPPTPWNPEQYLDNPGLVGRRFSYWFSWVRFQGGVCRNITGVVVEFARSMGYNAEGIFINRTDSRLKNHALPAVQIGGRWLLIDWKASSIAATYNLRPYPNRWWVSEIPFNTEWYKNRLNAGDPSVYLSHIAEVRLATDSEIRTWSKEFWDKHNSRIENRRARNTR